ncbi:MAG: site-specific DNA-methyltransferase [Nitrospirae bacterium]|nr:site-specific DNA-methyltransferase [Nitrospirota bacterium]
MDGESLDIKQDRLQRLKELCPELFAEGQLDWEKLKAAFGEDINFANERYVLNWAGKSDAFKILQQPTTATLKPVPEESYLTPGPSLEREGSNSMNDFINSPTENLFIEGENLEVLKVLQKAYYGKVKCIDIDPPYNTGSDSFIYPDKFSEKKEDYLKRIGDKDEEGFLMKEGLFRKNSKDSGHYHSNWLSMMYPRLFLAKNLLRDDGVIFVHIDDNEVHNLRMVMNEIFGEENFLACVIWHKKYAASNDVKGFADVHDYILVFQKSSLFRRNLLPRTDKQDSLYKYDSKDSMGLWRPDNLTVKTFSEAYYYEIINPNTGQSFLPTKGRCWLTNKATVEKWILEGRVFFGQDGKGAPQLKRYLKEVQQGVVPITYWSYDEVGHNDEARKEIKSLFEDPPFDTPKPTRLIKRMLELSTQSANGDIILDFFGGSATTADAVLQKNKEDGGNRKFIIVQMPEPCDEDSETYKAGCKTIADIGKERIRRVIQKIEKEKAEKPDLFADGKLNLGFKVFKLSASSFKIWRGAEIDSEEKLIEQLDAFTEPIKPGAEKQNMLYELMLKAGYELTSKVEYMTISSPPILGGVAEGRGGKPALISSTTPTPPYQGGELIGFYSINNNELIIALDVMNEKLIEQIIAAKPQKVITLDSLFTGNDQLKTNTVLQMRDAGIDFKTI